MLAASTEGEQACRKRLETFPGSLGSIACLFAQEDLSFEARKRQSVFVSYLPPSFHRRACGVLRRGSQKRFSSENIILLIKFGELGRDSILTFTKLSPGIKYCCLSEK